MHCWCVLGDNHGQGAGAPHPHVHMLHGWRWSYIYLFRIRTFMKNPPGVVLNLHGVLTDHFETYILFCVSVTCLFCVSVTCSSLVLQSIRLPLSQFQIFGTFLKGSSPSRPSIVKENGDAMVVVMDMVLLKCHSITMHDFICGDECHVLIEDLLCIHDFIFPYFP